MKRAADAFVEVRRDGSVAIVTVNFDPGRPALHLASGQALLLAIQELHADPACRSVVLTGRGVDFCPGGSLSPPIAGGCASDAIAARGELRTATTLFRDIRRGPKPVLAAVEGAARGTGLGLVAASDYVVAASNARFSCGALTEGLLPDCGLLWALPEKLGDAVAREILMLGSPLAAAEAQRLGLVSKLAAAGKALEQAVSVARVFDGLPAVAVALLKAALFNGSLSMEDSCRMELDLNPLVRQAVDHKEAVAAFMGKRPPSFVDN